MYKFKTLLALCAALLLTACGGGSGDVVGGGNTTGGPGGTNANPSANTYFPLQVYRQGENYELDQVFEGVGFAPFVTAYIVAPVTGADLAPAQNPKLTDYDVTVNGKAINHYQQYASMQRMRGLKTELTTAIIVDTSSYSNEVNRAQLKTSILNYITAAKASSNEIVRTQKFTLWSYANKVVYHLNAPTADASIISTALDRMISTWENDGDGSARNAAMVLAVGGFAGDTPTGVPLDFLTDPDLQDLYLNDGYSMSSSDHVIEKLNVSSVVLIGGGASSSNVFTVTSVKEALEHESFITYDRNANGQSDVRDEDSINSPILYLGKPFFYIPLGSSEAEDEFKKLAVVLTPGANYNFASDLVSAQQSAVNARLHANNRYLVRYATHERTGKYISVFKSRTLGYNYSLSFERDLDEEIGLFPSLADPLNARVEITTAANEYLASRQVRKSEVTKLYPATRYTTTKFVAADYEWTINGSPVVADSDGSISIATQAANTVVGLSNRQLSLSTTLTIVD